MGLSSCMASCLAQRAALAELLDCTMTTTADAVFRIVFASLCVCIRNGDLN